MSEERKVVIVGAGHNGLVTACYLARAGLKPLVLEARSVIGGIAATEEIHPGFRCPTVAHGVGPIPKWLVGDLQLEKHGLVILKPEVRMLALRPDHPPLRLYDDPERTAASLGSVSERDASRYAEFARSVAKVGAVLAPLLRMTPPSIDRPGAADLWEILKLGKGFRSLPKKDAFRLLRWGPMAAADFAAEWFESETLRAAIAARGIHTTFSGPWSAGSTLPVLLQAAMDGHAIAPSESVQGGPGAFAAALASAARALGAEIRTGSEVARISVRSGAATGVVLASGEEIAARAVVSGADPRRTFLQLVSPTDLDPDFLWRMGNYRSSGTVAKVNLALSALPSFAGVDGSTAALSGRIHIGPDIDYLERAFDAAKYGDHSSAPYLDVSIPSVLDSTLAPQGAHVVSIHAQFAPYSLRQGSWETRRESLGDQVVGLLESYAPGLRRSIVGRQVLTPRDLEKTYGLSGGHLLHGEPTIDQFFTMRPLIGFGRYRTPIAGLYLCGSGTHPGGGLTGIPGANASREIVKDSRRGGPGST